MSYPAIGYRCPRCVVERPKVYPAVAYKPPAQDEELHGRCVICGETDPKITYHNICLCCAQGLHIDDWYGWRILRRKWTQDLAVINDATDKVVEIFSKELKLSIPSIVTGTYPDIAYAPATVADRVRQLRSKKNEIIEWQRQLLRDSKALKASITTPEEECLKLTAGTIDKRSIDKVTLLTLLDWERLIESISYGIVLYETGKAIPIDESETKPDIAYKPAVKAVPVVLTMEEFHSAWEPKGWQLLTIGPTSTWRQDWGEWEAIRDIVQNCLDETEAYSWHYDDLGLNIEDNGRGLAVADFLLGPPKPKPAYARGKFGEGMKIAALALLRMGYLVKVETVGKEVWVIFLKVKIDGEAEQLAALWRSNGRKQGTVFRIMGYKGSAFEDRFAVNILKRDILHQGPSQLFQPELGIQRYNQLIAKPAGRIYARDIYVKDIDSSFSYNLWSFEMAPDRHGPKDESEMWKDAGRLWATCDKVELLERFLLMMTSPPLVTTDESSSLSMDWMGADPSSGKYYDEFVRDNAQAWRTAWDRAIGDNAVIRTNDRWDGVVKHIGYNPVSVKWDVRDALAKAIKTDAALIKESQERLREVEIVPDRELTKLALTHLKLARRIATSWPKVAGVHAAIIPPASDRPGARTAGMYSTTTQEIFIALDQLERAATTVDTVIHEIAHYTSGADDGQEEHNRAMTTVASHVVRFAAGRSYDDELREATWL